MLAANQEQQPNTPLAILLKAIVDNDQKKFDTYFRFIGECIDINASHESWTLLAQALFYARTEMVQRLLGVKGLKISNNNACPNGNIFHAIVSGEVAAYKRYVESHPNLFIEDILFEEIVRQYASLVDLVCTSGPFQEDPQGGAHLINAITELQPLSPLQYAIIEGANGTIVGLLKHNALIHQHVVGLDRYDSKSEKIDAVHPLNFAIRKLKEGNNELEKVQLACTEAQVDHEEKLEAYKTINARLQDLRMRHTAGAEIHEITPDRDDAFRVSLEANQKFDEAKKTQLVVEVLQKQRKEAIYLFCFLGGAIGCQVTRDFFQLGINFKDCTMLFVRSAQGNLLNHSSPGLQEALLTKIDWLAFFKKPWVQSIKKSVYAKILFKSMQNAMDMYQFTGEQKEVLFSLLRILYMNHQSDQIMLSRLVLETLSRYELDQESLSEIVKQLPPEQIPLFEKLFKVEVKYERSTKLIVLQDIEEGANDNHVVNVPRPPRVEEYSSVDIVVKMKSDDEESDEEDLHLELLAQHDLGLEQARSYRDMSSRLARRDYNYSTISTISWIFFGLSVLGLFLNMTLGFAHHCIPFTDVTFDDSSSSESENTTCSNFEIADWSLTASIGFFLVISIMLIILRCKLTSRERSRVESTVERSGALSADGTVDEVDWQTSFSVRGSLTRLATEHESHARDIVSAGAARDRGMFILQNSVVPVAEEDLLPPPIGNIQGEDVEMQGIPTERTGLLTGEERSTVNQWLPGFRSNNDSV